MKPWSIKVWSCTYKLRPRIPTVGLKVLKYITRNIKLRHISLLLVRNLFMKKDQIKLKICVMDIISKTLEGCQFSSLGGYKNDAKLYVL